MNQYRSGAILGRLLFLIILSALLAFFDAFNLLAVPKKFILQLTMPVEYGIYSSYQSIRNTFGFVAFWHSGYEEIKYLKQRNRELTVNADLAQKLKEENEILKSQFAIVQSPAKTLLPSKVINVNRYLYINVGQFEGIKLNQTVIADNVYVGRVIKTDEHVAKVILPTDPEEKIAVQSSKNRAKGIIYGSFGSQMQLGDVLIADKIDPEETVETFGNDNVESGLLIGKIIKVVKTDSALFQKAEVRPILEYSKLKTVFVKI